MFVVIIMALASTRPVLRFAENALEFLCSSLVKRHPAAWWLSILIVAPILGSFITEPGAMTIAAMLLAKKFYKLKPSPKLAYGTLGLVVCQYFSWWCVDQLCGSSRVDGGWP